MRKLNKTAACGILAAALAAGTLSGCSKTIDGTKTVATVGDEKVTLGLASYMVRDQQAQTVSYYNMLMSQYGVSGSASNVWDQKGDDGKTVGESSKDGVMKTINQLYVLKAHAADYDVTITEDEEKAIKEAAAEFIKDNDEKILKKLAVSEDDIVTYLELVTIRSKMHDPMTADVDTEVSANEKDQTRVTIVKVSTEGTEKDDDGNTIDLTDEEKAQKKDLAQQVLDKVKASDDVANADMDALAKEVDDSLSATAPAFTTAGDTDDTLDEAVQDAALELKDGEVADKVIEGDDGYYVVRLDKMLDEDATENKEKTVISERKSDLYDNTLEDWVKEEKIKVDDKVWDQIKVTDSVSFEYKSTDSSKGDSTATDADSTKDTEDTSAQDSSASDSAAEDSAE
ncbi:peptidyl-prolyl cis-trans isomerase [Blautia sp.]|uniref:peptidyl-prolyl cis-trans isomerase n=1 Tax=Blautia sp. TaxID=1955243 RepID=UPI002580D7DE|nr:peptidyl-prolyl cis-trans isomerase [Blautia sp.]